MLLGPETGPEGTKLGSGPHDNDRGRGAAGARLMVGRIMQFRPSFFANCYMLISSSYDTSLQFFLGCWFGQLGR